jgi:hypothetical protein
MAEPLLIITIPQPQIDFLSTLLGKATVRRAMYQAVKRTTTTGKNLVRDAVEEDTTLQRKYINRAISSKISTDEEGGDASGTISVSGKSIPMVGFQHTEGPGGVSVVMTRSRGPLLLRHAFLARVRSNDGNHLGIMTRKAAAEAFGGRVVGEGAKRAINKRGYFSRLPMQEEKGENLMTIVGRDKLTATGAKIMSGLAFTLKANLQGQLDRFLNQKKGEGVQLPG